MLDGAAAQPQSCDNSSNRRLLLPEERQADPVVQSGLGTPPTHRTQVVG